MFEKLKQHWKVNGLNLTLIILTFALGGSLCGYTGRKLLALLNIEKGVLWLILYIVVITLLWPLAVLLVSVPLGQFTFFKKYIYKILKRFGGSSSRIIIQKEMDAVDNTAKRSSGAEVHADRVINIAIFASGAGSNAENIITYSREQHYQANAMKGNKMEVNSGEINYRIALIVCNKPDAGVLRVAEKAGIPYLLIEKDRFFKGNNYLPGLQQNHIDFIVLAGFLWKIPGALIKAYPKKIINIHPALLPKYGGKGMFGHHVHEAVIGNMEKESGITIHYVDELYDHGKIIFQAKCTVDDNDTADLLAQKIHALEHQHYPRVITDIMQKQNCS